MPIYFKAGGGGGGAPSLLEDAPIGTTAYFPVATAHPEWITGGRYDKALYPDLAAIEGYPSTDDPTAINWAKVNRINETTTTTQSGSMHTNWTGDVIVYNSNEIGGSRKTTLVNKLTPFDTPNDFLYQELGGAGTGRFITRPNADGWNYYFTNSRILKRTNLASEVTETLLDIADPLFDINTQTLTGFGIRNISFTSDNRIIFFGHNDIGASNIAKVCVSAPNDFSTASNYTVYNIPYAGVDTNDYPTGVGYSKDISTGEEYIYISISSAVSSRTLSEIHRIKLSDSSIVDVTNLFSTALITNLTSERGIALSDNDYGVICVSEWGMVGQSAADSLDYQTIKNGLTISSNKTTLSQSKEHILIVPIYGSTSMWHVTTHDEPASLQISTDDLETLDVTTMTTSLADSMVYSKALNMIAGGNGAGAATSWILPSAQITQSPTDDFLASRGETPTGSHKLFHKALA